MFLGLASAIYPVADLAAAKAWYARVLGQSPYFDQPFYVGFSVGGFELGLLPKDNAGTSGVAAHWRVEDAVASFARLVELGATPHEPVADVGEGIKVASVVDPFGNVLSIIENPSFGA
jgi:catechol 2,3-dioxygenase-like lactoylglutathione lyase family enzyme